MSRCKSCDAEVRWVETINGKRMPLDAAESVNGNVVMDHRGRAVVYRNALSAESAAPGQRRFTSHFVTCPDAKGHRR